MALAFDTIKQPNNPFNCVQIKLLVLDRNTWNHLTVCERMTSASFKNVIYKSYIFDMYISIGKIMH